MHNKLPGFCARNSLTAIIDGALSDALSGERQNTWAPEIQASFAMALQSVATQIESNPVMESPN